VFFAGVHSLADFLAKARHEALFWEELSMTMTWPNQCAAANGLSAVRSSVAGNRERTVRSTAAAEAFAELGR